jgi:peroxiredoxin
MSLRLGDTAPDFSAESSEGQIKPYLRLTPQPK